VRRSASSILAVATGVVLVAVAHGGGRASAPPSGAALAALSRLPTQSSLASQRIYFVMPDRYADGAAANDTGGLTGPRSRTGFDPTDSGYYHGGDLLGLRENLKRIRDLGFTALWVTPVLKQQAVSQGSAAYHGYWGLDFTTVDPHLGTDQEFADLVAAAHALGLKVYLDVVVNHTADVVQLTGSSYSEIPYRDCHGRRFDPARYTTATRFPCLRAANMPRVPFVLPGDRHAKNPSWLNDPLNYHDRGNIDFGSCSEQCFEQGDFFGLDDLFTEKPNVMNGLAQIYGSWITRFKVDGFRVDTAKHVNAAFFRLWVPKIRRAAASVGIGDFPIFGEVTLNDAVDLAPYVRERGLPQVLDFPFQQVASAYAAGASGARGVGNRLSDDDYFRTPDGVDPAFPTFLGNHDMGRGAQQILSQAPGLAEAALLQHVELGYDLLYLLRGAPVVQWGDEVGMIGSGGDKAARQDMFPTQVSDWRAERRVGSPPIGTGSSFAVHDPLEDELTGLAGLRDAYPQLATGSSTVLYAKDALLVVRRTDLSSGKTAVVAFNNGATTARASGLATGVGGAWKVVFGTGSFDGAAVTVPPVSALAAVTDAEPAGGQIAVRVTAQPDPLTTYEALTAALPTTTASVAFAIRRATGDWQRVAIDDSAPYRAFLSPGRFERHERVQAVAVARTADGTVSLSPVVTFTPRR
jgi:glycosidase